MPNFGWAWSWNATYYYFFWICEIANLSSIYYYWINKNLICLLYLIQPWQWRLKMHLEQSLPWALTKAKWGTSLLVKGIKGLKSLYNSLAETWFGTWTKLGWPNITTCFLLLSIADIWLSRHKTGKLNILSLGLHFPETQKIHFN